VDLGKNLFVVVVVGIERKLNYLVYRSVAVVDKVESEVEAGQGKCVREGVDGIELKIERNSNVAERELVRVGKKLYLLKRRNLGGVVEFVEGNWKKRLNSIDSVGEGRGTIVVVEELGSVETKKKVGSRMRE